MRPVRPEPIERQRERLSWRRGIAQVAAKKSAKLSNEASKFADTAMRDSHQNQTGSGLPDVFSEIQESGLLALPKVYSDVDQRGDGYLPQQTACGFYEAIRNQMTIVSFVGAGHEASYKIQFKL